MTDVKISELKTLCELELSILNNGKINTDESGFFESEKDKCRLAEFVKLQDKYNCGWYIAQQTIEDQIKSINNFKRVIIEREDLKE